MSTHWFLRVQLFACKPAPNILGGHVSKCTSLVKFFSDFNIVRDPFVLVCRVCNKSTVNPWPKLETGDSMVMARGCPAPSCRIDVMQTYCMHTWFRYFTFWLANCHVYSLTSGLF